MLISKLEVVNMQNCLILNFYRPLVIKFWLFVLAGQRFQIPFDSGREQNSQIGQILQNKESFATKLEIVSSISFINPQDYLTKVEI